MDHKFVRWVGGALLGVSVLSAAAAAAAPAQQARVGQATLATSEQIAAERTLLALLADPEIKAAQARLIAELEATPTAQLPDGRARIAHAVALWTNALILRELAADPEKPAILWLVDNTPHNWFGHRIDGMAIAGDNPDHIYRGTFLDGSGRYEIEGQIDPARRPVQFSFEVSRDSPGRSELKNQNAGHADMGNQIAMLTDRKIKVGPDGRFRLIIGGGEDGDNHLRTEPGPISVMVRDVLSDWQQQPNRLTIRRLDRASGPADAASVRQRTLADLPGFVRFWSSFKDTWFGGLKPNQAVGPVPRDGGWGFQAAARYHLAPGEALVITTTRGSALYTGIQATDPWMVTPDSRQHQTSINLSQARANPDGTYTYVVAPEDPGVANWVDTAGLHDGFVLLRWQQLAAGATADGLLQGFRLVRASDLAASEYAQVPRVTPAERRTQIERRAADYLRRLD